MDEDKKRTMSDRRCVVGLTRKFLHAVFSSEETVWDVTESKVILRFTHLSGPSGLVQPR